MSVVDRYFGRSTPWGKAVRALLDAYGLGALFAANVLGAGSVYILAQTGASTGFALLWVLPLAFCIDMVMHDLSGRMAKHDEPLMEYISNALMGPPGGSFERAFIGHFVGVAFAITMALVMQLWAVANYAVAGYALSWFVGGDPLLLVFGCAIVAMWLIGTGTYKRVEGVISALVVLVFAAYFVLTLGAGAPPGRLLTGLVPRAMEPALVIALLGTTVYYPNFFIQSSMHPTKEWLDLGKWRRDNAVGVGFSILISAAMLVLAAVALQPGEITLTAPGEPLVAMVGSWAMPVFMVAVLAASFTSATGTLFGSGFAVPQALGKKTEFGDRWFTGTVMGLILISSLIAVYLLETTNLTPVRMAITMPAVNGLVFLPITIVALYCANRHRLSLKQKVVTIVTIAVLLGGTVLTARALYDLLITWI